MRCVALRSVGASASCVLLPARFCQRACSSMRRGGAGAAARALPSRSTSTVYSEFQSCARCQHFCGVCTWPATWFSWIMCSFAPPRPAQRFRTGWTRYQCPQLYPSGHASGGQKGEPLASHGAPRGGKKKLERARGHVGRWHRGAHGRGALDGICEQLLAGGAAADGLRRASEAPVGSNLSRARGRGSSHPTTRRPASLRPVVGCEGRSDCNAAAGCCVGTGGLQRATGTTGRRRLE